MSQLDHSVISFYQVFASANFQIDCFEVRYFAKEISEVLKMMFPGLPLKLISVDTYSALMETISETELTIATTSLDYFEEELKEL